MKRANKLGHKHSIYVSCCNFYLEVLVQWLEGQKELLNLFHLKSPIIQNALSYLSQTFLQTLFTKGGFPPVIRQWRVCFWCLLCGVCVHVQQSMSKKSVVPKHGLSGLLQKCLEVLLG